MLIWVIVSAAIAFPVASRRQLAGLAAATVWPVPSALLVAVAWLRFRDGHFQEAEMGFHYRVAAELRAGMVLRAALATACEAHPALGLASVGRHLTAGLPIDRIMPAIRAALPVTGELAAAAIELSLVSGGRTADTFGVMAELASSEAAATREIASATAPARFALVVVAGLPVAAAAVLLATGRLGPLVESSGGRVVASIGFTLIVSGTLVAVKLMRGAL